MPLPEYADAFIAEHAVRRTAACSTRCCRRVRERTQLAVQRADFKHEQLPPHLLMNLRVVDEHGRQLGIGATWPR